MRSIKWGILGTSFISEVMAQAIQASEHSQLVAVGSRSHASGKAFSEKFSIPKFSDYEGLLNDQEIDVVYIGLPNHLHKEWILNCTKAGKQILCEKPLVLNVKEILEVINAAKKSNVLCVEALMYLSHPFYKKIRDLLIKDKVIGDIRLYHAAYTANIAEIANPVAGGCIRNLACYPVSLIRMLAGSDPTEMNAMGRLSDNGDADRQASLMLKFNDDSVALISSADDIEMFWQFEVFGTKGRLKAITNPWMPDIESNIILLEKVGEKSKEINVTAEKPLYTYQIDAICEHLLAGKNEVVSLSESASTIQILEAWLNKIKQPTLAHEKIVMLA